MKHSHDELARYLAELEREVSAALAPAEVEEVLSEVSSHLLEASGTDPDALHAALTSFGPPRAFAREVLADRGLESPAAIPEAPVWRQSLAFLADVFVAAASLVLVTPIFQILVMRFEPEQAGVGRVEMLVLAGIAAAALAWTVSYWRSRRPGASSASFGLALFGVSHVRVGDVVRRIRAKDLARHPGLWYRVRAAAAVFLATALAYSLISAPMVSVVEQEPAGGAWSIEDALRFRSQDAVLAAEAAQQVYDAAAVAGPAGPFTHPSLDPVGTPWYQDLIDRFRTERIEGYRLLGVLDVWYDEPPPGVERDDTTRTNARITLDFAEIPPDETDYAQVVGVIVEKRVDIQDDDSWSTDYLVVQIAPTGDLIPQSVLGR